MKILRTFGIASAACTMLCMQAGAELNQAAFEKLHAELQPDASEAWRQIPWKISVLEGQRAAVDEGKPIFIWAMDGHPLGCT